jgi:Tfp pilus assembly protein PilF
LAINKRKVLDAARKYAQKGAKQKAVKEYNKLIQADPRDAKLLLEVGDAYRRWGQAEEAIAQYSKVASQYKQDGFDARAVAVLKQILNLDPKRLTAHVSLAELYQRMGLDSDAIGALQTAADGFYRDGRRREALELLRKMASLDPSNTTSRLKVADLLHQEEMDDDAVAEYEEVAAELKRQGANEQLAVVYERIVEIQPARADILSALAQGLSDAGRPERAEAFAVRALEASKEPEQYELLCGIYKSLGNDVRMAELTRDLAAIYRNRGDEDHAREVMQRLPAESVASAVGIGQDESEMEDALLGEDELLEDEDFLVADDDHAGAEMEAPEPEAVPAPTPAPESETEAPLPDGDPEQLLAEASVYLRYGKRAQAIASLNAVLLQEPDRRDALEKLGEAHAEGDANDEAVQCWTRAAELARTAGDAGAHEILRDRIAALDPVAAGALESMVDSPEPFSDDSELALDLEEPPEESVVSETAPADEPGDLELDLDVSMDEEDADEAPAQADAGDAGIELDIDADLDLSIDDDDGLDLAVDVEEPEPEPRVAEDTDPDLDLDENEFEIDVDVADDSAEEELEAPAAEVSASASFSESSASAAQIKEELEEAEFYIQQGLADEAEAIYRRVLSVAPNHPGALLKLGELAAAQGADPGAAATPQARPAPDAAQAELTADDGIDLDVDDAGDEDMEVSFETADDQEIDIVFEDDEDEGIDLAIGDSDADDEDADEDLASILAEAEAAVDAREATQASDAEEGGFEIDLSLDDDTTDEQIDFASAADEAEIDFAEDAGGADDEPAADEDSGEALGDLLGEDATEVEEVGPLVAGAQEEPFASATLAVDPGPIPDASVDDTMPLAEIEEAEATPEPLAAAAEGEESFDLAEALADVFEDANAPAVDENETSGVLSTVEEGFESIFADFKKGVSDTLEAGDYDTRYDLGIAYREMGLFDDAIAEFRVSMDSDSRRLESLYMMGLCAFELGRLPDAINHLEQALAMPDLPQERLIGVQFDLGRAYQASGDRERARGLYEAVAALDASFPGVSAQIASLDTGTDAGIELEEEDDSGYESFDDLMSDDDDDVEAPEAETFESFDDLVTDAEVGHVAEAEPVDEDPGDTKTKSKAGGRKKKISFV